MRWDELLDFNQLPPSDGELALAAVQDTALLRVSGSDAAAFLQAQFCNDIDALAPNGIQLNGYCTPKGRLLAVFHLIRTGEDFLMWLPTSAMDQVLKRLRLFVLRADVTFTAENSLDAVALHSDALHAIPDATHLLPEDVGGGLSVDRVIACRLRHKSPSIVLFGTRSQLETTVSSLTRLSVQSSSWWRRTRLLSGEPVLTGEAIDRFVPQMLNMDLIGGLSFNKGCYPGQEIVARTRYLGKQKRRMLLYTGDTAAADLNPGDALSTTAGDVAAEVVASADAPQGRATLAVVRLEHRDQTLLHHSGATLTPIALPYDPLSGTEFGD